MKNKLIILILSIFLAANFLAAAVQKISSPFSQAKFVPNISAILDVSYIIRDMGDIENGSMYTPGYFTIGEDYNHGPKGFSFNYFELALESVVDPYFDLFTVFQFINGEFSIEEAFFKTRSLPAGFQLKGGKFFSAFGRLNAQHDHIWNFCDPPLVYRSIFGSINLNDLGVQLNWVAPIDLFIKAGIEIFQGQNPDSQSFYNENMVVDNTMYEKSSTPLLVSFVKSSADIGNFIILGGVSLALGKQNKFYEDAGYGITGTARVWGIDMTVKYLIDSYRYVNWQSEFLYRTIDGNMVTSEETRSIDKKHHGFYSELVYRFNRRWRCGLRYGWLKGGDDLYQSSQRTITGDLNRISGMIEFNATEFSRIRIQYNYNKSKVLNGELRGFSELFINCNLAIGAHGAHKF